MGETLGLMVLGALFVSAAGERCWSSWEESMLTWQELSTEISDSARQWLPASLCKAARGIIGRHTAEATAALLPSSTAPKNQFF